MTSASAVPLSYRVVERIEETHDMVTLSLEPAGPAIAPVAAGQFTMLYAYGVGEIPISVSGLPGELCLRQTIRTVGAVSQALYDARPGATIGVRGPFGTDWRVADAVGLDLVLVAGGCGLPPLRSVLLQALADRGQYRRVVLVVGARTPADLPFARDFADWREHGVDVRLTVDHPDHAWTHQVGLVTELIPGAVDDPAGTAAFVCGPEMMMRFSAEALLGCGVPADRVLVSLERNMQCAEGLCGHCQLGPLLLCRDGAVVGYDRVAHLVSVREL